MHRWRMPGACEAVTCGRVDSSPVRCRAAILRRTLPYVERNPVRAGLVSQAEQQEWSSAAIRVGLVADRMHLADKDSWQPEGGTGW